MIAAFLIFAGGSSLAGRPLEMDDADAVEQGQFEFEAGGSYAHDSELTAWEWPFGLTAGILPNVEAGLSFGGVHERRVEAGMPIDRECGVSDLELAVKWKFFDEASWLPAQALAAAIKVPTADEDKGLGSGETDYDLTWIASKKLGEKTGVHLNAGYTWVGEPAGEDVGDVFHYGIALDYQLTEAVQWVGEVFAEKEVQGGTQTLVQCNTGFRYSVSDRLTLDLAAGTGLHGDDTPDLTATAGLTWAFGL